MPFVRHVTLVANTVSSVAITDNSSVIEVLSRNGLGEVFISHDGSVDPTNPTVGGNDFDVIPASAGAALQFRRIGTRTATVELISAAATTVSVRGIA